MGTTTEFEFKLRLLEKELEQTEKIIDRLDNLCQTIKYWTIVVFMGVSSAILSSNNETVRDLIVLTPCIPVLFWVTDASWRRHQNRAIFRSQEIRSFINSDEFSQAFRDLQFNNFTFWDVMGDVNREKSKHQEYKRFTALLPTLWFRTIYLYYVGLILLGIIMTIIIFEG